MQSEKLSVSSSELNQQEQKAIGLVNAVARSVFFCGAQQGLFWPTTTDRLRKDQLQPFLSCSKRYIDDLVQITHELGGE